MSQIVESLALPNTKVPRVMFPLLVILLDEKLKPPLGPGISIKTFGLPPPKPTSSSHRMLEFENL
jgi:hypothetical protein